MSTSICAGVGDLPCFPTLFSMIPTVIELIFPYTYCLVFCNTIMTGEPTHTTQKKE